MSTLLALSLQDLHASIAESESLPPQPAAWHVDYFDPAGFWRCLVSNDHLARALQHASERGQLMAPLRVRAFASHGPRATAMLSQQSLTFNLYG